MAMINRGAIRLIEEMADIFSTGLRMAINPHPAILNEKERNRIRKEEDMDMLFFYYDELSTRIKRLEDDITAFGIKTGSLKGWLKTEINALWHSSSRTHS